MIRALTSLASGEERGSRWAILGVLALAAVVGVLVVLALGAHRATTAPTAAPLPPQTTSPAPTETDAAAPAPETARMLQVGSATTAWRATRGSCEAGGAMLERTLDGGATWQVLESLPTVPNEILELRDSASAEARIAVLLRDATCTTSAQRSFSAGDAWQDDPELLATPTTVEEGVVLSAGTEVVAPCETPLRAVIAVTTTAILCTDGLHLIGGQLAEPLPGVHTVGTDGQALVVVRSAQGCDGVEVASIDPLTGADRTARCTAGDPSAGPMAVDVQSGTAWLWHEDRVDQVPLSAG